MQEDSRNVIGKINIEELKEGDVIIAYQRIKCPDFGGEDLMSWNSRVLVFLGFRPGFGADSGIEKPAFRDPITSPGHYILFSQEDLEAMFCAKLSPDQYPQQL